MPATTERLVGRGAIISFQSAYPEPWGTMRVERVLDDTEGAAAEVSVVDPSGQRFVLASFWRVHDGLLHQGVEYWVSVGGEVPPPSRSATPQTKAAINSWEADPSEI